MIVALLSLAVAASLLLTQRDYKRMLAYHSIEHMGLIALGAAAGIPLAIAAVLLHILGHGLAKSVLFLTSGEIMAAEGTSQIDGVRSLLARRPALGGVFGVGLLALSGFPPFSLFISELGMFRAEFEVGLGWAAAAAMVAMVVIFIAVVSHARHMLLGTGESKAADATPRLARRTAGRWSCALRRHRRFRLAACQPARGGGPRGGPVIPTASKAGDRVPAGRHRSGRQVLPWDLVDVAQALFADGMRLALVSGHDDGARCAPSISSSPGRPTAASSSTCRSIGHRPDVPTLAALSFPASRFERELADLFGIVPVGHPQPRRLVLHQHWPEGWHPMRHDAGASAAVRRRCGGRSPSSPSRGPASTRSRSARSTPASSNPGTSASGWWGRPSCA